MSTKVVITCSLTGVLTDPQRYPVPVSIEELSQSAKQAYDAGASCMHIHFRQQEEGKGHLPSWDPQLASSIAESIRNLCPDVIINFTTGTIGRDQQGPIDCILAGKPEIAACNAGSLNYLKVRSNGSWAWPPLLFENPVEKVEEILLAMNQVGTRPEFECFDIGIVRAVGMFQEVGMVETLDYNLVMGVDSGMPCDAELLPLLLKYMKPARSWQTTLIGRQEIWPVHRKTAALGGHLRTGVEDTFYLPNGERTSGNGELIESLVKIAEEEGRVIASPQEARELFL